MGLLCVMPWVVLAAPNLCKYGKNDGLVKCLLWNCMHRLRDNLALAQELLMYKWEQGPSPAPAVPFAALAGAKMHQLPL